MFFSYSILMCQTSLLIPLNCYIFIWMDGLLYMTTYFCAIKQWSNYLYKLIEEKSKLWKQFSKATHFCRSYFHEFRLSLHFVIFFLSIQTQKCAIMPRIVLNILYISSFCCYLKCLQKNCFNSPWIDITLACQGRKALSSYTAHLLRLLFLYKDIGGEDKFVWLYM